MKDNDNRFMPTSSGGDKAAISKRHIQSTIDRINKNMQLMTEEELNVLDAVADNIGNIHKVIKVLKGL